MLFWSALHEKIYLPVYQGADISLAPSAIFLYATLTRNIPFSAFKIVISTSSF